MFCFFYTMRFGFTAVFWLLSTRCSCSLSVSSFSRQSIRLPETRSRRKSTLPPPVSWPQIKSLSFKLFALQISCRPPFVGRGRKVLSVNVVSSDNFARLSVQSWIDFSCSSFTNLRHYPPQSFPGRCAPCRKRAPNQCLTWSPKKRRFS